MLFAGALENWQRQAHGPRVQVKAISFVINKMVIYDTYADVLGNAVPSLGEILQDCKEYCTPDVHIRTLRRWWYDYKEWGELQYKVAERKRMLEMRGLHATKNELLNDADILVLKEIVDENPNLFLDELAFIFGIKTGTFVHYSTIRRCLTEKLRYSMKVLQTVAKQQCEMNEIRYLQALEILLQSNPERLVTIDETHKDRNAARRRRGWGKKGNTDGAVMTEWFESCVRYTLIAAADINGFIPVACRTVIRDEISDEGAAGTVDGEYFLYWITNYLCPTLGSYELGEARSVVLMDNASTHMSDEVERVIQATGAVLIYGAPFSPHLNPIEYYFAMYKSYLKKNDKRMVNDWQSVHAEALLQVDRDMGIKFFRKSKVPGSFQLPTTAELNRINSSH